MYLEKQRKAELAKRKGMTKRTFIQGFFMLLAAGIAGGLVYWLEISGTYRVRQMYAMGIPRDIPEIALMIGLGFVIMIIIQFCFAIGFVIGSPQGREKQGVASARTSTIDFKDSSFDDY